MFESIFSLFKVLFVYPLLKGQGRQLEREASTLHSEQRRAVQKNSSVSGDLRS